MRLSSLGSVCPCIFFNNVCTRLFPHLIFYSFNEVFNCTDPSALFTSNDAVIPSQNAAVSFVVATNSAGVLLPKLPLLSKRMTMDLFMRPSMPFASWHPTHVGRGRFPSVNNYAQVMGNISFLFLLPGLH